MLDWLLTADGVDVAWTGGRAVTFPKEARYCFKVVPSGGDAEIFPVCKTLRNEGMCRPVPEIGVSTSYQSA